MKKEIILTIFSIFIIFSINQNAIAEEENADNKIKGENSKTEPEKISDESKTDNDKEVKKKLSKLKKFLPTEEEFDEITQRTVWRYVDKQSNENEEFNIEKIQGLVRDIGRVYDPIVNKYKVATMQIEIIKFEDLKKLEDYWLIEKNTNLEDLFNNAYLITSPNNNTKCFFNYSNNGAMTVCKTDEFVIQSIIFDKYQEHYTYTKPQTGIDKLEINQDEMTTSIVDKILKKIQNKNEIKFNNELYKILQSNIEIKQREQHNEIDNQNKHQEEENKLSDMEKHKKYGIQNISCIKDEFGLITISGQYNNNEIKKNITIEVTFMDFNEKTIFKNTTDLLQIDEFETKRFVGNLKMDQEFTTCLVKINN